MWRHKGNLLTRGRYLPCEIRFMDVRGWHFLAIEAAETLCMVCLPSEEHIFRKKVFGY